MNSFLRKSFVIFLLATLNSSLYAQDHSAHQHAEGKTNENTSEEEIYTCSMHPEVRTNKPGACPICHMPLIKVSKSKTERPEGSTGVSGRATVALKEGEEKLLGLEFYKIEKNSLESQILSSGRALSRSKVFLQVPESDVASVKVGAKVTLESPSLGTEKELGTVESIDTQLEPSTRTLRVIVTVKTLDDPNLLPESTVMARIELKRGEGLWVPETALIRSADRSYVFVLKNSKLIPTEVALGSRVGQGFELKNGLEEGNKILSQGAFLIDSESRLRGR